MHYHCAQSSPVSGLLIDLSCGVVQNNHSWVVNVQDAVFFMGNVLKRLLGGAVWLLFQRTGEHYSLWGMAPS
jgi:hypothetical protein